MVRQSRHWSMCCVDWRPAGNTGSWDANEPATTRSMHDRLQVLVVITLSLVGQWSIVMSVSVFLCIFVRLWSYLWNYTSDLHLIFYACSYGRGCVLLWWYVTYVRFYGCRHICSQAEVAWRRRQAVAVRLTRMQPWAWRVGISVACSGRSGQHLAVRAY